MVRHISANSGVDFQQAGEESRNLIQRNHIGTVAQCTIGLGMSLEENAIRTSRKCGTRQHGSKLPLTAGFVSSTARQLHRMSRIKYDRKTERAHNRNRTHVGDEIIVSKCGAALSHEESFSTRVPCFL